MKCSEHQCEAEYNLFFQRLHDLKIKKYTQIGNHLVSIFFVQYDYQIEVQVMTEKLFVQIHH
jgi:hypothetical protein